jgi:hypothetical protein
MESEDEERREYLAMIFASGFGFRFWLYSAYNGRRFEGMTALHGQRRLFVESVQKHLYSTDTE